MKEQKPRLPGEATSVRAALIYDARNPGPLRFGGTRLSMVSRVLIIACGNPLRSDDGVAWRAAEALEAKLPPDQVEIFLVHQLAPELAEPISRSRFVIFLDAATAGSDQTKPGEIRVEQMERSMGERPSPFCHTFSPTNVLGLAEQLYGVRARAYFVSMVGQNFSHGEFLSAAVASSIPEFIAQVEDLIRDYLHESTNS
jgi:hydrogenase maturation protease